MGAFPLRLYIRKVLTFEGKLAVNRGNALARFQLRKEKFSEFSPTKNLVVERITFESVGSRKQLVGKQLAENHTTELTHLTLHKRKNKHREPPACIEIHV